MGFWRVSSDRCTAWPWMNLKRWKRHFSFHLCLKKSLLVAHNNVLIHCKQRHVKLFVFLTEYFSWQLSVSLSPSFSELLVTSSKVMSSPHFSHEIHGAQTEALCAARWAPWSPTLTRCRVSTELDPSLPILRSMQTIASNDAASFCSSFRSLRCFLSEPL